MATRSKTRRQVVMTFDERHDLSSPRLRGGKGAHLAEMRAMGLPVPPGFTVSTTVARAAMHNDGQLPNRLQWQLERCLVTLERQTGKRLGDTQNPLLVSVRSGAAVSMPGMMDTVLNLGMNRAVRDGLARAYGEEFANDCWRRFVGMYASVVLDLPCESGEDRLAIAEMIPSDPRVQLQYAILAVLKSWDNPRAKIYRELSGIPETLGTAITVQAMAFGNLD